MAQKRYIAFHKPYGVLSQFSPEDGARCLNEFGLPAGVYAVGRLDKDSEGLLLLSDDGPLIKRLLDPDHGHPRSYLVQVERIPEAADLARLARGVSIKNYQTRPCKVQQLDCEPELPPREPPIRVRKAIPTAWLRLVLTEGKNRQVRRMTAAIGFPTLRLVRESIAGLALDNLKPGQWREVSRSDLLKD